MSPARGDPPGVPAALPPDHDDDDGGAARRPAARARHGHRRRAAPPARHHDRRRPAAVAGADALHDAGHLPVHGAARARRAAAERRRAAGGRRRREHLGAVHPAADRDLAARGGAAARRASPRSPQLPVAPLPRVDFPTINVSAALPGAQPADDGVRGGDAARAPLRPHRRRHRDDLDQRARLDERSRCSSISTATSTGAARDVQAAINAAGGELPAEPADAARTTARSTRPTRRS